MSRQIIVSTAMRISSTQHTHTHSTASNQTNRKIQDDGPISSPLVRCRGVCSRVIRATPSMTGWLLGAGVRAPRSTDLIRWRRGAAPPCQQ